MPDESQPVVGAKLHVDSLRRDGHEVVEREHSGKAARGPGQAAWNDSPANLYMLEQVLRRRSCGGGAVCIGLAFDRINAGSGQCPQELRVHLGSSRSGVCS